jgi:hypothetical protein
VLGKTIRKNLLKLISVISLFLSVYLNAAASDESWEWFSDKPRTFKALYADPRETQTRLAYLRNHNSYMDFHFGGHLGVVRKEFTDSEFALIVRGMVASRFQMFSGSFDLQNDDFIGGLAASYKTGPHSVELFISHQSSHLGDEVIRKGILNGSNVSFESIRLLYSRELTSNLRAYGGTKFIMRSYNPLLRGNTVPILGAEWRPVTSLPGLLTAADIRFKQENHFSPNFTAVVAYELGNLDKIIHRQRIFLEFYSGHSNQGQFFSDEETSVALGFAFTL